jgi:hypothetical protein
MTYEPTNRHICSLYYKGPLTSLPIPEPPKGSSICRTEDASRVSCRLGPRPRKVGPLSSSMLKRRSHPEAYISEEQVRERFAAGLWSLFEIDDI